MQWASAAWHLCTAPHSSLTLFSLSQWVEPSHWIKVLPVHSSKPLSTQQPPATRPPAFSLQQQRYLLYTNETCYMGNLWNKLSCKHTVRHELCTSRRKVDMPILLLIHQVVWPGVLVFSNLNVHIHMNIHIRMNIPIKEWLGSGPQEWEEGFNNFPFYSPEEDWHSAGEKIKAILQSKSH